MVELNATDPGFFEFQGAFTHQDFAGHKGTIRTGDVQVKNWISGTKI